MTMTTTQAGAATLAGQEFQTAESRYEAMATRDPAADGQFIVGVITTGIYCRNTCPARRPKRENVRFFDSPEQARTAGFRACLRCDPDDAGEHAELIERVREMLHRQGATPSLAELAREAGLSAWHVQRVFKRATGVTPRQYAEAHRASRLREELKSGSTVTDAMYAAGYGSARALYESGARHLGMKPSSYRNGGSGETVSYAITETPLGTMLLAATERGVCALRFGSPGELLDELRSEYGAASLVSDPASLARHVEAVMGYINGVASGADLPLDLRGTPFQLRVWEALRAIPPGETRTYGELARVAGRPGAARAVGRACATNPVAIGVPCHRAVRADGSPGGYRWGVDIKEKLLEGEARRPA